MSDAAGTADFAGLPGTYRVRVEPPAGARLAVRRAVVSLGADTTAEVALAARARLGGALHDDGGTPVAGGRVCAFRLGEERGCARSGADGSFTLDLLPAVYRLQASGPAGARLVPQWAFDRGEESDADPVDLRAEDVTDADVTLVRGVALEGRVRAAADGRALGRAQVCLRPLAAPLPFVCERTAADGSYRALRGPGRYWVWVVPPDGEPLVPQWYEGAIEGRRAKPFVLAADARLDMALDNGPAITGRVRDPDGAAVVAALVCADTPFTTGRICRPTDAAGEFSITVRPETYVLNVEPPAGSDLVAAYHRGARTWLDAEPVVLADGARVELTLVRGVRVTGVVRDESGEPVADAQVALSDAEGWRAGGSTDLAGRFAVVVPPAAYTFEVFAPRFGALVSAAPRPLAVAGPLAVDTTLAFGPP